MGSFYYHPSDNYIYLSDNLKSSLSANKKKHSIQEFEELLNLRSSDINEILEQALQETSFDVIINSIHFGRLSLTFDKIGEKSFLIGNIDSLPNESFFNDLCKNKVLMNHLLDNSGNINLILNEEREIIYANQNAVEISRSASLENLIGRRVTKFILEQDQKFMQERFDKACQTLSPNEPRTMSFKTADNKIRIGESQLFPFRHNEKTYLLNIIKDVTEGISMYRALQASEKRLQKFITNAPVAIAMFDNNMKYIACSDKYLEEWKVEGQEINFENIKGKDHYEVFSDVPGKWREIHHKALKGEFCENDKDIFTKKDGKEEWVRWDCRPWYSTDDSIGGIILFTEFITQKIKVEREKHRLDNRNRALLNAIPDMLFIFDKEGNYIDVEARTEDLMANTREQLIGSNLREFFSEDESKEFLTRIRKAISEDQQASFAYSLIMNNKISYYEARLVKYEKDTVLALVRDVTENKEIAKNIVASEQRFYKAFHSSPIPMSIIDIKSGEILDFNNKALKLVDSKRKEVVGTKLDKLNLWKNPEEKDLFLNKLMNLGRVENHEGTMLVKYGEPRDILISAEIVEIQQKPSALLMIVDMTERKKAEKDLIDLTERLRKSNEELRQFAYITSHNFRGPVVNLESLIDLYKGEKNGQKEIVFNKIITSVKQLKTSLDDLIDLVADKEKESEKSESSLVSTFKQVQQTLDKPIRESGALISTDFKVKKVKVPKPILESILYNLISNALKYRRDDASPVIEVSAEINADKILLKVSDNGIGIDLEKYGEKLFNLYQRLDQKVEGKGLGLYIIKAQVENVGGKINVKSELDKGSTFYVYFPA